MKNLIGKVLCCLGRHKWENPKAVTLRCTRCPEIHCIGLKGLVNFKYEEEE